MPEKNKQKLAAGQDTIFDTYRHHGFFTTISPEVLDIAAADRAHRGHAVIAHNLLRTVATLIGGTMARARALSLQARIISIPARIAHRARRVILHLPTTWKWARAFTKLWAAAWEPPPAVASP